MAMKNWELVDGQRIRYVTGQHVFAEAVGEGVDVTIYPDWPGRIYNDLIVTIQNGSPWLRCVREGETERLINLSMCQNVGPFNEYRHREVMGFNQD